LQQHNFWMVVFLRSLRFETLDLKFNWPLH
jgi:hypothetical protein